jgi:hypothetical protein
MKKQKTLLKALVMLIVAGLFTTGSLYAQNTTITDLSTYTADASAVLDVYANPSATGGTLGMLLPRLSADPTISSPATGLIYFNTGNNVFKYFDGTNWKVMAITEDIYWTRNSTFGWMYPKTASDYVGIGQIPPPSGMLNTWLTIYDGTGSTYPQFHILGGGSGGDASMRYSLWGGEKDYCHGILDNSMGVGDNNFKICNDATLAPDGYGQMRTMMEIHDEDWSEYGIAGIIDFNHQSRARVWLNFVQTIPTHTWQPIDFDNASYDEHVEFTLATVPSTPGGVPVAYFTATEEGYYQVNSRTEFYLGELGNIWWVMSNAYVSIAIYKGTVAPTTWSMYAQGNNLQVGYSNNVPEEAISLWHNNAPNVSDVVYLQAGEKIAIYAWQSSGLIVDLTPGTAKTYVSIHKVS